MLIIFGKTNKKYRDSELDFNQTSKHFYSWDVKINYFLKNLNKDQKYRVYCDILKSIEDDDFYDRIHHIDN